MPLMDTPAHSEEPKTKYSFIAKLALKYSISIDSAACFAPHSVQGMVAATLPWQISVSRSGYLVAILQDTCVEIRCCRDGFGSIVGHRNIALDPFPQWRCTAWSPDESMVACSRSTGTVDIFDVAGFLLSTIQGDKVDAMGVGHEMGRSVSALIFPNRPPSDAHWNCELIVITYSGQLDSYYLHPAKGHHHCHQFNLSVEHPFGVNAAILTEQHNLLIIGGASIKGGADKLSSGRRHGLSAWRVLSEDPYYKLVCSRESHSLTDGGKRSLVSRIKQFPANPWTSKYVDGVFRLCISPDGSTLVVIHLSGSLSILALPSLFLKKYISFSDQPGFDEINITLAENPSKRRMMKELIPHNKFVDVNFWSNQEIILARCSGAVTVACENTLDNLLGSSPEWFEPSPRITEAHDGGFLCLECDVRFPKQRDLVAEDDVDDSDDEDFSVISTLSSISKRLLYFLTDKECFHSPKKHPKMVTKVYRLLLLKSTSPEELFARKIDCEEYGEALALAKIYDLDCDLVYQRQWRCCPVSVESIQDYLSKITKRSWVLHECVERVPDNIDVVQELLLYGLQGTALPSLPAAVLAASSLTLEQKEICRTRHHLLQYLDRLKTYEYIMEETFAVERFNADFFRTFRACNLVEIAVQYARNNDWRAVEVLFTYHHSDLNAHRLAVLSNFPETTNPMEYSSLLPELNNDVEIIPLESNSWREKDWSELDICREIVGLNQNDLGGVLYDEDPALLKYRTQNLTVSLVQEWYEDRAEEIDTNSCMVQNAFELIKFAILHGFHGLHDIFEDLVTMELLVYECGVERSLSFVTLREMSNYDRLELMMEKCPMETYSENLHDWLVPFLERCDARNHGAYFCLLKEFLVSKAQHDLQVPVKVFQCSKPGVKKPIIVGSRDKRELCLQCLYVSERDDQLDLAMTIFECVSQVSEKPGSPEALYLCKDLDRLECHLMAANILQHDGEKRTLHFIKECEGDSDLANNVIVHLAHRAAMKSLSGRQADQFKLLDNMMMLRNIVFRCLSPSLCLQVFVKSMLCSAIQSNICLAGQLIERRRCSSDSSSTPVCSKTSVHHGSWVKKLEFDLAVPVVLSASRDYIDSSVNMSHECMNLARACLFLILDPCPDIQDELDLIVSVALLEDFGVDLLPLQVRQTKDRLNLVSKAVVSKPANYRQSYQLLQLAHLLRVPAVDKQDRHGQVLLLLAKAALCNNDVSTGYSYCHQLVLSGYGAACSVCIDLAEKEALTDTSAKLELLSFAISYCSEEMMVPVLQSIHLVRRQVILQQVSSSLHRCSGSTHCLDDASNGADSSHNNDPTEDTATLLAGQPRSLSVKAALQQTHDIFQTTRKHTAAVLSSVTDTHWWKKAVSLLQPLPQSTHGDDHSFVRSCDVGKQGCHPFYEGVLVNCCVDKGSFDYGTITTEDSVYNGDLTMLMLRAARLEERLTEGERCDYSEEALITLAVKWFSRDTSLSLACLLALQEEDVAERCFDLFNHCGLVLEVALYLYSIQIQAYLHPCYLPHIAPLYSHPPSQVVDSVLSMKAEMCPTNVAKMLDMVEVYQSRLADWRQASMLTELVPDVKMPQFSADGEYRREIIMELVRSCHEKTYVMAMSLAEKYCIALWDMHMEHLEFLFSHSRLSTETIEARVSRLRLLEVLYEKEEELCTCLYTMVFPSLPGNDVPLLTCFFSLLDRRRLAGRLLCGLAAAEHLFLLRNLLPLVPDADYVRLMDQTSHPKDVLAPFLTVSNISSIVKLVKKIPDKRGGFLHPSSLYCVLAVNIFWHGKSDNSHLQNDESWVDRYKACRMYLRKLLPGDFTDFVKTVTCSLDSSLKVKVADRQEIVRRSIKFCHSQLGRMRKHGDSGLSLEWSEVEQDLQSVSDHLNSLLNDMIKSFSFSENQTFRAYAMLYDQSAGDPGKVVELLEKMVKDGQPLELVEDVFLVKPPAGISISTILHTVLSGIVDRLRDAVRTGAEHLADDLLRQLTCVVENVQEHLLNDGELITRDDVFEEVNPYITDSAIPFSDRISVLEIINTLGLGASHSTILLHYKTVKVVNAVWEGVEVKDSDVATEPGRAAFFEQLFAGCKLASRFKAVCRLLSLWPPFFSAGFEYDNSPWARTLLAMSHSTNLVVVSQIDFVLKDLGTADFPLSFQETREVFDSLLRHQHSVEAVKLLLRSSYKDLYMSAILLVYNEEEGVDDPELVDLLLRRGLTPHLVSTPVYMIISQVVIKAHETDGDEVLPHLMLDTVVGQLCEAGLQDEAKLLKQKAQTKRPLLRSVGSALGAVGSWFKS